MKMARTKGSPGEKPLTKAQILMLAHLAYCEEVAARLPPPWARPDYWAIDHVGGLRVAKALLRRRLIELKARDVGGPLHQPLRARLTEAGREAITPILKQAKGGRRSP